MKIQELLSDESKWTRGEIARGKNGEPIYHHSEDATCWCLYGAALKCYTVGSERTKVLNKISDSIGLISIRYYNDTIASFQDIRKLVEELDI